MAELSKKDCIPCEDKNFPPLTREQAQDFMEHVPHWSLSDDAKEIHRVFRFKDFKEALAFVNKVGEIAEEQSHHPDIQFGWGKVQLTLTTHSIEGLSESDFIIAARVDLIEYD